VVTLSLHEAGRWPFTGTAHGPHGKLNLPLPQGCNDSELRALLDGVVRPVVEAWRPEAIMLQCGADALEEDPLARLSLSNNAHAEVIAAMMGAAPRFVLLGGWRLQPVERGALLVPRLGRAERAGASGPPAARSGGDPAPPVAEPRGGAQSAGALVHHAGRRAARGAGARGGAGAPPGAAGGAVVRGKMRGMTRRSC
jgi:acetoin utilization protein AcuC